MQNRYTGDIGDFGKLGLLRALQASGLSIGVNWYLVPDEEHNNDGRYVQYTQTLVTDNELHTVQAAAFEPLEEADPAGLVLFHAFCSTQDFTVFVRISLANTFHKDYPIVRLNC